MTAFNQEEPAQETPAELGASMVEYAFLVSLIAIVCIAAVTFLGTQTSASFSDAAGQLT